METRTQCAHEGIEIMRNAEWRVNHTFGLSHNNVNAVIRVSPVRNRSSWIASSAQVAASYFPPPARHERGLGQGEGFLSWRIRGSQSKPDAAARQEAVVSSGFLVDKAPVLQEAGTDWHEVPSSPQLSPPKNGRRGRSQDVSRAVSAHATNPAQFSRFRRCFELGSASHVLLTPLLSPNVRPSQLYHRH